jgi:hypothetical protein
VSAVFPSRLQWRFADNKLRVDLFGRRYKIYEATRKFLVRMLGETRFDQSHFFAFHADTGQSDVRLAKWTFDRGRLSTLALSCHEISPVITAVASLEKRSVSNLIEVMADERWKRFVEQQGVAYAKTVAEAMKLKLDMDNPADREKLRRAILDLVAERKMRK